MSFSTPNCSITALEFLRNINNTRWTDFYLPLRACCHFRTHSSTKSSSSGGPFVSIRIRWSIVAWLSLFRSLLFCLFWVLNALSESALVTGIIKAIWERLAKLGYKSGLMFYPDSASSRTKLKARPFWARAVKALNTIIIWSTYAEKNRWPKTFTIKNGNVLYVGHKRATDKVCFTKECCCRNARTFHFYCFITDITIFKIFPGRK